MGIEQKTKYLEELLNIYWIRPENAFWVTKVMQALDNVQFERPSLDLMCGHGMWSFIRAGGAFGIEFDVHQVIKGLNNYRHGEDIQDSFSDDYKPIIIRRPNYKMDCGLDWKENNLKKCETLDFYEKLVQADCNRNLPFEDGSFKTIFSNTIYWVDKIDFVLEEVARLLSPDGRAILVNYLPPINNYLDIYKGKVSAEWINLIDRNRSNENKHIFSREDWTRICNFAGLEVVEYRPTVGQVYAHIWNIGLRPLAPYIIEMSKYTPPHELLKIKSGWLETLRVILTPLVENELFYKSPDGEEVEGIFILKKKV